MIPQYINDWIDVIDKMRTENTYKLAFGRAIIQCIINNKYSNVHGNQSLFFINFNDMATCIFRYYWNQLDFFCLRQNPIYESNIQTHNPRIIQYVTEAIKRYKSLSVLNKKPIWFDDANHHDYFLYFNKKICNVLPQNVAWRFCYIGGERINLFKYDKENDKFKIYFTLEQIDLIKGYWIILDKLLLFKWALLLEKFNDCPKLLTKLDDVSKLNQPQIQRKSLNKYKNILIKQFNNGIPIDFYTNKPIPLGQISVDHVIPWSYMYSDDIWNLVLTSKSNNSKKSSIIPNKETINKLINRNKFLVKKMNNGKQKEIMNNAIKNNYVSMFYEKYIIEIK